MRFLVPLLVASTASARPPSDADFAKLAVPKRLDTVDLCIVVRRVNADGKQPTIALSYAEHGHISKQQRWDVENQKLSEVTTYAWADGRIRRVDLVGVAAFDYTYDRDGLIASTGPVAIKWHVVPVASPVRALWPAGAFFYPPGAANQLPFAGTLDSTTDGKTTTMTYSPGGTFVPDGCTLDPNGRLAACHGDEYTWSRAGELLGVRNKAEPGETQFRWDDKHRVIRRQYIANGTVDSELRYEYRCDGVTTDVVGWWSR